MPVEVRKTCLGGIPVHEMQRICKVPTVLLSALGPEDHALGRLQTFARYLAGVRWSSTIEQLLNQDDLFRALTIYCCAPSSEVPQGLLEELKEAWRARVASSRIVAEKLQSELQLIPLEAQDAAKEACTLLQRVDDLRLSPELPTTPEAVQEAEQQWHLLHECKKETAWVLDYANLETKHALEELHKLGLAAWSRLTRESLLTTRMPSAAAKNLLQALPRLVLERQTPVLRSIVESEDLEQIRLAEGWFSAAPIRRQNRLGWRAPTTTAVNQKRDLSPLSRALIADVTAAAKAAPASLPECLELIYELERLGRERDRGIRLIGAAKSMATDSPVTDLLLGVGLLESGKAELGEGKTHHARKLLIDALNLLTIHQVPQLDDSRLEAADCLAVAFAWPIVQREGEHVRAWVRAPERMYAAAIEKGLIESWARGWASDLDADSAAEVFLSRLSASLGDDVTLFRHCARALLRAPALLRKPALTLRRIERLLEPVHPPLTLRAILAQSSNEIGPASDGGAEARGTLRSLAGMLAEELNKLRMSVQSVAPIEEIGEQLPKLLHELGQVPNVSTEPALSVRTLVPEYWAPEGEAHLCLAAAVSNAENAAPAPNVSAFIRIRGAEGYPVIVVDRVDVGELAPGEERELQFEVNVPKLVATQTTEWKYRIELDVSGQRHFQTLTTKVLPELTVRRTDPFKAGEALRRGELFVGRERELRELRSILLGDSPKRALLIHGIRRIGKTSLVHRLLEDEDVRRRYATCFWDVEDRPASDTSGKFLRDLALKIRKTIPAEQWPSLEFRRDRMLESPFEEFAAFIDKVENLKPRRDVLIAMDEFDRVVALARSPEAAGFEPELLGALRKTLMSATFLHIVFCGLPTLVGSDYDSRLFGLMHAIPVHAIKEDEADEIINQGDKVFVPTAASRRLLHRLSGRQPYLLQAMCSFLFHAMQNSGRRVAACFDVMNMVGERMLNHEYTRDYERLIPPADFDLFRALAFAHRDAPKRDFVSTTEVVQALRASGIERTRNEVQERLSSLAGYGERDEMTRPLVARASNNRDQFQLTIGLLGLALQEAA